MRETRHERELDCYIDSPSRPGKTAVEVYPRNTALDPLAVYFSEQPYTNIYRFNEINAIPPATETTIVSYAVPPGKSAAMFLSQASGNNVAEFRLYANSTLINMQRTFYGDLNATMRFELRGYELVAGDIVSLKVIHNRPMLGSFSANLQIKESI